MVMSGLPEEGDVFSCTVCGMSLEITTNCGCEDTSCVSFMCCNQQMISGSCPEPNPGSFQKRKLQQEPTEVQQKSESGGIPLTRPRTGR